jgi:AcrR family transcriptional regulator
MERLPRYLSKVPVGREQLPQETLAYFQRDRIVRPATGVFAKRGYQATTVDHLVEASRASVGGFYQHFDGKEDCFLAVFDRIVEDGRRRLIENLAGLDEWSMRAYVGLRDLLDIYVSDPLAARIVLAEANTAGEVAAARYNALIDALAGWLGRGRDEFPAAMELPATFEQAAVSGTAYFLYHRLLTSRGQPAQGLLEEVTPLVLEPMIGLDQIRRLSAEVAAA